MKSQLIEKRFERKYVFKDLTIEQIAINLMTSDFFFREHYPQRDINSIYFDKNFRSLIENVEGISNREKLRLRWYGNHHEINSFYVEKKIKENFLSKKKRKKILLKNNISLYNDIERENILFKNISFDYDPIVFIKYKRIYFISDICPIRATIDYDLSSIKFFDRKLINEKNILNDVILEFKYNSDFDDEFRNKITQLNLRFSKNSKYVNSIIENPDLVSN